jgi:ABC-2 type transport system permease protein
LRFQSIAVQTFSLAIRDGQTMGTLEVLLSTPTNLALIVLSSGAYAFVYQLLQTCAYVGFAMLFGLSLWGTNVITLAVFLFLAILAISPIGVMAAAATMVFKKTGPIEFLLTSVTTLFGGIYLPIRLLPAPLQVIGTLLPITHALNGIRAAIGGATLVETRVDLAWLLGMTALLLPASLFIFAYAVKRAKIDGTLGQY